MYDGDNFAVPFLPFWSGCKTCEWVVCYSRWAGRFPKLPGTDISGSSGERWWATSVCEHLFIHPSFLASNLTEGMQYGLVECNFFPELTSVMCDNSSDPVMYDRTTWRCVYSSFQVPQKDLGSCGCGNSVYQALPLKLTTTCEVRFT